ncbi:MAG: O-antigen ligase family protein [Patescibacteria group bacterium]
MQRKDALRLLKVITYIGIYGGLLLPAVFIPVVIFPFVFSKLIIFQILIGITFPAYVALAWAEPKYRPKSSILYLAIIAYFLAMAASVVFSVDIARSWWGNQERMNGLFTLLHFLVWLTMTIGVIKTWTQWRRLFNYEIALSVFMAVVAILQKPFPRLLLFPAGDRVGGLLDNPIYMAAYQIFNLFFISLLWMKGATRNQKIWYTIAALIDIVAFMLAQSRGALVGLGVGIIVFVVAYAVMTPNKKARYGVIIALICCVLAYGGLIALRNTEIVRNSPLERFTNLTVSSQTRLIAWDIAWHGFLERPLTGWGLDTFHILFNKQYHPESLRYGYYETWFDRSHNTVLDVLSMTGLFGFVTFFSVFIALFWLVIRAYRKRWIDISITSILLALPVAYFIQNLFVFDHPAGFSMSYLMYAFVIVATTAQFNEKTDETTAEPTGTSHNVPWIAFGVLQLAAFLLVWRTSVLPFKASVVTIKSNNAFGSGAYQLSYDLAKQAAAIPTPYLDEQTFLQSRNIISLSDTGKLKELSFWREWHDLVVDVSKRQTTAHPANDNPHFIFARFGDSLASLVPEDAVIADTEYKTAIALSPKRQQVIYSYSRFLINQSRPDEAWDQLKQVVSYDPKLGESHWLLGLHEFFDRQLIEEGADELIASAEAPYPYSLKEAREAMALAMAYDVRGRKDGLTKVMTLLPTLPQGAPEVYLQIARVMEHQGMTEERNRILSALARIDQNLAAHLAPLMNGSVTSIQASFVATQNVTTTPAVAPTSQAPNTTTIASTTGGTGPRK